MRFRKFVVLVLFMFIPLFTLPQNAIAQRDKSKVEPPQRSRFKKMPEKEAQMRTRSKGIAQEEENEEEAGARKMRSLNIVQEEDTEEEAGARSLHFKQGEMKAMNRSKMQEGPGEKVPGPDSSEGLVGTLPVPVPMPEQVGQGSGVSNPGGNVAATPISIPRTVDNQSDLPGINSNGFNKIGYQGEGDISTDDGISDNGTGYMGDDKQVGYGGGVNTHSEPDLGDKQDDVSSALKIFSSKHFDPGRGP